MRVLITGVTGLLGRYLVGARPEAVDVLGISRLSPGSDVIYRHIRADLADAVSLAHILESTQPDSVIHCAAEGQVDAVEGRMDEFRPLNVQVTQQIATYCGRKGVPFVFISSNAVFGGSPEPYSDYSRRDPINDYGRLKVEAEDCVLSVKPDALLVRPILMYGWPGPGQRLNPVVTWVEHLRQGKALSVVQDVWTQPLWAQDCASAIWRCVELGVTGPVNISGGTSLSLHEFAKMTCQEFNLDGSLLTAASSSGFEHLAPRPKETAFDLVRLKQEVQFSPTPPGEGLSLLRRTEPRHLDLTR